MNWRQKIIADWPFDLQKSHRCKMALADLDRILGELAGLGHPLHIEEGYVQPPRPDWPKAVFHIMAGSRVVNCQADLDELGPDWYPTMEEARHQAGVTKQNQRGGIFTKALPSLFVQTPEERLAIIESEKKKKQDQIQRVKDARLANRASFAGNIFMHVPTTTEEMKDALKDQKTTEVLRGRTR